MDTDGDEFEAEIETSGKYMYITMRYRKITVDVWYACCGYSPKRP